MIYKLTLKKSREVKNLVEAETKGRAILYFAALLHLSQDDMLEIYNIS
jgi:chromatin segregation and condensation protein Rec8/ScpA/Scc1 (kleisin family)